MSFLGSQNQEACKALFTQAATAESWITPVKNSGAVLAKDGIFLTVDQARMLPNLERYS
jgi:hypothetical protein